jgi:YVTN family beta-propeller protein
VVVTSYNNAVTFIDVATNKVTDTLLVGGSVFPSGLAISDDGQRAYVTSFIDFAPALLIIDLNTRTVKATLALSWPYPENVYLSPDQTLAYVTYPLGYQLDVIDVLTNTVAASLQSIPFPDAVAFNRTGTRAYVVSQTEPGTVQVLDTATNRIVDSFTVGSQPRSILLSSDGRLLAVQNYNSTFVSLIDLTTHVVSQADIGALYGMGISFLQ